MSAIWSSSQSGHREQPRSSGYSTTEALAAGDAKALATLVRAPQYLEGAVTRTPTGYKIDSRLIITRDMTKGQILPTAQGGKLDDAANQVAKSIKDARRQLGDEETCHNAVAQGKYQDAVAAARKGLAGYPTANILGVCLAEAYNALKMPDSVIAVAERIRASDPRNVPALKMLAEAYGTKNDVTRRLQVLSQLAAADPTNIRLIQDVVADMARLHHPEMAVPLMRDLMQNNPGDPQLLNLAWLVYLNAAGSDTVTATRTNTYQAAIDVGNEMIRVDTTAVTADFYSRLAAAYLSINQPQKAQEVAAIAARKFPNDCNIQLFNAQSMYKAGQLQQAEDAAKKAVACNPKNGQAYFLLATIQSALPNKADDMIATLNSARPTVWIRALFPDAKGSDAYKHAVETKEIADYQRATVPPGFRSAPAPVDAKFALARALSRLARPQQPWRVRSAAVTYEDSAMYSPSPIPSSRWTEISERGRSALDGDPAVHARCR
jgi:tetratricopeptide (TPR) repeat protein